MRFLCRALFWTPIFLGPFALGWLWLGRVLSAKAAPALLLTMGFFFTLSNAMLAMLFRQYNEAPPKDMTQERKRNMRRKYSQRLGIVWRRYYLSLLASTIAVVSAWSMTNDVPILPADITFGIGCAALSYGATLSLLAVWEVQKAAEVSKKLVEELEQRKRKNELLAALADTPESVSDKE